MGKRRKKIPQSAGAFGSIEHKTHLPQWLGEGVQDLRDRKAPPRRRLLHPQIALEPPFGLSPGSAHFAPPPAHWAMFVLPLGPLKRAIRKRETPLTFADISTPLHPCHPSPYTVHMPYLSMAKWCSGVWQDFRENLGPPPLPSPGVPEEGLRRQAPQGWPHLR